MAASCWPAGGACRDVGGGGVILADKTTDKFAWLEARRTVVTASEIGVIVRGGAGRAALLAEKRSGEHRDLSRVPAIRHGLAREPVIARWATARWPHLTVDERLVASDEHPRHAATCDMTGPDSVAEIKTGGKPWGENAYVDRYFDQVLWQLHVTGKRYGWILYEQHDDGVPVGFEPLVVAVPYDAERVAVLVAAADEFLAELDDPAVEAPEIDVELDELAAEYLDAKDAEAARTATKKARWADLQERLRERGSGTQETEFARVTWSTTEKQKTTVDEVAARAADPDLAARWDALLAAHTTTETVTDRRLTVTRPKEGK